MTRPAWADKFAVAALFLALWGFHLWSAGGTVVPYRDTGEMVVNARTLGIAHPPGYPLYVLLSKAADLAPWGSAAYRANAFSALAAALAGLLLFFLVRSSGGAAAGAAAALLWASSPFFRELAAVSEMYTLAALGAFAAFLLAARAAPPDRPADARRWAALFFLLGLFTGARSDMVLLLPACLFLLWRQGGLRLLPVVGAAFAAGMTIFLYLPFRSARQPWIDWNDPEGLSRLAASLMRKSHGGTLDLLSKSYGAGENFLSELRLFAAKTAGLYGGAFLPLAALGAVRLRRAAPAFLGFAGIAFAVAGPLFIYLANMPPNPHALAVVEAHYVLAQVPLAVLAGFGLAFLLAPSRRTSARLLVFLLAAGAAVWQARAHEDRAFKRWNLYARDYVTNVCRSAAPGSVGVLREDVPLFAFWERTLVGGARPDLDVVAQGLSASPWYQAMLARQGKRLALGPLRERGDWDAFLRASGPRPVWVTGDVNFAPGLPQRPGGLAVYLAGSDRTGPPPFDRYVLRGALDQTRAPDFFSSDLMTEYARAAVREATAASSAGDAARAENLLRRARSFDPESPTVPFHLGYRRFQEGDYAAALAEYARGTELYETLFRRAAEYKTLPAVVQGLRNDASELWTHRGVASERLGDLEAARACYERAVRLNPASAQAHFNWAVTYWNRDWAAAARHLEAVLAIDPSHPQARASLERARAFAAGGRP